MFLAGIFNFAQSGYDALTQAVFDGDPTPVNCIQLGVAFVAGIPLLWFVWSKTRDVANVGLDCHVTD